MLVTGITGTTGRRVAESLVARGVGVRALVRDLERGKMATLGIAVELVLGDFERPESVLSAARGCDGMYLVSVDGPRQIKNETTAARLAFEAGIRHIVKLSSSDAGQRPYNWSLAHHAIEKSIADLNVGYSFLRPHYFMHNFLSLLKVDPAGVVSLEAPAGSGAIGAVDDFDIGECAAELLAGNQPLGAHALLTGPENITFERVASALGTATNDKINYVDLDPVRYSETTGKDNPESAADVAEVYREVRDGTMAVQSHEVERITGNRPRSIEQFALANVDAIKSAIASALR
ncbi:MAG: NmrA family NAD(P)-binding protein [Chloroflexi bacterium]|nr:NmrA family NAD(P)-binding protein [Chloroflexota bacterium]